MKVLVLSDIHYPSADEKLLKRIIKTEKPDKLVLLGDIINEKGSDKRFFRMIEALIGDNYYFVRGDEDKVSYGLANLTLEINDEKFFFAHGHKLQLINDKPVAYMAGKIKLLNVNLPVFLFAAVARTRRLFAGGEIILGHTHALRRFPRLKVTCAGTLTTLKNIYNDHGYVVIDKNGVRLIKLDKNRLISRD